MNKVLVRCWEVENYRSGIIKPDRLFITYPEDNNGHELITCLNCGMVYAVTVLKEVYFGPPLPDKLKEINCIGCGKSLGSNYASYPETYVINRNIYTYQRSKELPDDAKSFVKDFWGIYE